MLDIPDKYDPYLFTVKTTVLVHIGFLKNRGLSFEIVMFL